VNFIKNLEYLRIICGVLVINVAIQQKHFFSFSTYDKLLKYLTGNKNNTCNSKLQKYSVIIMFQKITVWHSGAILSLNEVNTSNNMAKNLHSEVDGWLVEIQIFITVITHAYYSILAL
jgi:hypothetical protein